MTREEFIEVLDEKNYPYEIKGDKIVVHGGNIYLGEFKSIPPGVVFNNRGNLFLHGLETLPSGVEFNNGGDVYLYELKSISSDVEFRNSRDIYLESLETISSGVTFGNNSKINLPSLRRIPSDVKFNNRNVNLEYLMGGWFSNWRGNIREIDYNGLLNKMVKDGVFEKGK